MVPLALSSRAHVLALPPSPLPLGEGGGTENHSQPLSPGRLSLSLSSLTIRLLNLSTTPW